MNNPSVNPENFLPLANAETSILVTLLSGEQHGYSIMKRIEANGDRFTVLGATTLYRNIKKLLKRGLIEEVPPPANVDKDDERRKYYRLTGIGRRVTNAELDRLQGLINVAKRERALQGGG